MDVNLLPEDKENVSSLETKNDCLKKDTESERKDINNLSALPTFVKPPSDRSSVNIIKLSKPKTNAPSFLRSDSENDSSGFDDETEHGDIEELLFMNLNPSSRDEVNEDIAYKIAKLSKGVVIDDKKHKCPYCEYRCHKYARMKVHLRTHTGEKPYKCPICDFATAQKANLNHHLQRHTGHKPFACPHCDHRSSRKTSLSKHLLTHTGERPFQCPHCSLCTNTKSGLTVHIFTHFGLKRFACPLCEYKASVKPSVTRHIWAIHEKAGDCPDGVPEPVKIPNPICMSATSSKKKLGLSRQIVKRARKEQRPQTARKSFNKNSILSKGVNSNIKLHSGGKDEPESINHSPQYSSKYENESHLSSPTFISSTLNKSRKSFPKNTALNKLSCSNKRNAKKSKVIHQKTSGSPDMDKHSSSPLPSKYFPLIHFVKMEKKDSSDSKHSCTTPNSSVMGYLPNDPKGKENISLNTVSYNPAKEENRSQHDSKKPHVPLQSSEVNDLLLSPLDTNHSSPVKKLPKKPGAAWTEKNLSESSTSPNKSAKGHSLLLENHSPESQDKFKVSSKLSFIKHRSISKDSSFSSLIASLKSSGP